MLERTKIASDMCKVGVFAARRDPCQARAYEAMLADRISNDQTGLSAASLFQVSAGNLHDRDARVSAIWFRGWMMTAVHAVLDTNGTVEIGGLVKEPIVGGEFPRRVVAESIADAASMCGKGIRFHARIRIFPDGWRDRLGRSHTQNLASRRLFESFGFVADPTSVEYDVWRNTYADAHLKPSLEPDGRTYRSLTIRSTSETVALARRWLLQARRTGRAR